MIRRIRRRLLQILFVNFYSNIYIDYETNGDTHKILSVKK